jgi:bifunctional DNA-binding transcriptional regulator/antitoxin component of YhaV-PrlF toxin-antitoxin module
MTVMIKGQVTIPQKIRENWALSHRARSISSKKKGETRKASRFRKLRGVAGVKMTIGEIMALTREKLTLSMKKERDREGRALRLTFHD